MILRVSRFSGSSTDVILIIELIDQLLDLLLEKIGWFEDFSSNKIAFFFIFDKFVTWNVLF